MDRIALAILEREWEADAAVLAEAARLAKERLAKERLADEPVAFPEWVGTFGGAISAELGG
jgi:hypothetical protein